MPTSVSPINPLDIEFRGIVVLRIAARSDGLELALISEEGDRKIPLRWRDPKPSIVSPCWKPAPDSNGYDIEVPDLDVLDGEFAWVHCGMKYSLLVSTQSGKPSWLKVRPHGPK